MAKCGVLVDSLTQFTADILRFTAAETRYYEFISLGGGGGGRWAGAQPSTNKGLTAQPESANKSESTKPNETNDISGLSALSKQIAYAREQIASSLKNKPSTSNSSSSSGGVAPNDDDMIREENLRLKKQLEELQAQVTKLTDRVSRLETKLSDGSAPAPVGGGDSKKPVAPAPKDDEDDVDLFGSDDEEDEEAEKIKEQRLAEYAAKKSKKPTLVAKSNVIFDVKPWDDETDMKELEKCVRSVEMEGLLWGTSKLVPLAYGIKKLQITTVVVDDLVSIDELVEKLQEFEDFIQSVDIAAFNKI